MFILEDFLNLITAVINSQHGIWTENSTILFGILHFKAVLGADEYLASQNSRISAANEIPWQVWSNN